MNSFSLRICLKGCDKDHLTHELLEEGARLVKEDVTRALCGTDFSVDKVSVLADYSRKTRWGGDVVFVARGREKELEIALKMLVDNFESLWD